MQISDHKDHLLLLLKDNIERQRIFNDFVSLDFVKNVTIKIWIADDLCDQISACTYSLDLHSVENIT
jgi:hypothetical protein